jgi:hypothetical protein
MENARDFSELIAAAQRLYATRRADRRLRTVACRESRRGLTPNVKPRPARAAGKGRPKASSAPEGRRTVMLPSGRASASTCR